jgi:hypothetical protein
MRRCSNQYARPLHAFTFKNTKPASLSDNIKNYCILNNEQYACYLEQWINVRIYNIRQYYMFYNCGSLYINSPVVVRIHVLLYSRLISSKICRMMPAGSPSIHVIFHTYDVRTFRADHVMTIGLNFILS